LISNIFLLKYERLQNQERDVLREMYNLQTEPIYPATNIKPTINLTDIQKNQFEELQRKNLRLERERRSKNLYLKSNQKYFSLFFFIKLFKKNLKN